MDEKEVRFFRNLSVTVKQIMKIKKIISDIGKEKLEYPKDIVKTVAIGLLNFNDLDKESQDVFLQKICIKVLLLEEEKENE